MYFYYTDYEPEYLWVAENEGQVVGFLAGSLDTRRRERMVAWQITPRFIKLLLTGRYHIDGSVIRYALNQFAGVIRSENPPVDLNVYPAHLHINLDEASRGLGLGKKLMEAFLIQLREAHSPGVHLHTTSKNIAAIGLYKRFGFNLLSFKPTRAWKNILDEPVENQAYGLRLR